MVARTSVSIGNAASEGLGVAEMTVEPVGEVEANAEGSGADDVDAEADGDGAIAAGLELASGAALWHALMIAIAVTSSATAHNRAAGS